MITATGYERLIFLKKKLTFYKFHPAAIMGNRTMYMVSFLIRELDISLP